jgi:hypothetical protein
MALTTTQSVGPNVPTVLPGLLYETAFDNLTATGNNQATAYQLVADGNRFTTVPLGSGCLLPMAAPGLDICIVNHGANPLQVYGQGTDTVDDVAGATGVPQMANSFVFYECFGIGKWYTNGLGTGFPPGGSIETVSSQDNISAAGTTQATATPLMAANNRITTAGAGTGVNLPPSAIGLVINVINAGANPVNVYPAQGATDTINGFSAATGVPFVVNSIATFYCETAGAWQVLATQPANSAYNTDSNAASHTLTAASITGAEQFVALNMTGAAGAGVNATLPTVAALIAALHSPVVGSSYTLRIINNGNASTVWTILTSTGWTLNGTMTIALNTYREFVVTLNTTTTATLQSMGQVTVTAP